MKISSASGLSVNRSVRRTAKVIRLPVPRRRQRRAARVGTVVVALGVIGAMTAHVDGLRGTRLQTASIQSPLAAQEFQVLKLVNDTRAHAGLRPLQFSLRLMIAARNHSRDMAARGYLGHESPAGDTPTDRARAAGINYDELAENVYRGDGEDAHALTEHIIRAWLQSRAHRANLMCPRFHLSAVGISRARDGNYYVTQDFIR